MKLLDKWTVMRFQISMKLIVPDQVRTLSQVGTNARSSNMDQKVFTCPNSQGKSGLCSFMFINSWLHVFESEFASVTKDVTSVLIYI